MKKLETISLVAALVGIALDRIFNTAFTTILFFATIIPALAINIIALVKRIRERKKP